MYERYAKLRDERGLKDSDVAREVGLTRSLISSWKKGVCKPKRENVKKIADFFGVSIQYLMDGDPTENYYINEETAKIAQEIFENPELRVLFSASRDASPEDLLYVSDLLLKLKRAENR